SYEVILTFMNIGHYYYSNGNLNLAINYFSQALPFINEDTIPQDVFDIYYNLGVVYNDTGNFEKSIEYFIQALSIISTDKSNPYFSATLNNLGFSYAKKGLISGQKEDFDHALEYFQQALEANEKNGNTEFQVVILNNLGSVKAHLGENLEALYYLNKARSLAEKQNLKNHLSSIYTNIGIIYSRLGDYQNSTLYYDKAINLALTEKENKTLWESYLEKGNLLKKQGDLQSARFYYLNSINIIESLRSSLISEEDKANFLGTDKRLDAYHNLIDLLIKESQATQNRQPLEEAFSYLERARARVFLEQIEASKLAENQPANIRLVNQEKELMSDISRLFTSLLSPGLSEKERASTLKEIKALENHLENLKRQIRSQNPTYAKLIYPEIISFPQVQKEFLDRETAIFSFMLGREVSYALVLTRKGIKAFPLPAQEELKKKVITYRRAISDPDNKDFQLGLELYHLLLKPALPENISRLIIVPDNVLNLLPFEALKPSSQPGDWLINHFNISYTPSLSSLKELVHLENRQGRGKPARTLFAVGDPYYGELENNASQISSRDIFQDFYGSSEIRFSRLKYSADEINRISRLFPGSTVLERDRASEDLVKSVRLSDYHVIHLAAHSLIDDQKPARSAIILTLDNDPNEDGFLQMREILNLKLNADLVVLSACQTGLGRLIRGEGLEGLSQAFFFAGASSVLTSLWAINDQVSSQFMERFYLYLKSSNTVSDALRKAKLEMISSSVVSHPCYWAPFILYGNGQIKIIRSLGNDYLLVIALTMA
ncbi:MAG: CHAT domain-containing protein, partial [Candidatus Aminicenantes bacterium]|nr:CHAT domain-containing protein [Candidatus Aminicenantes bacterium]